MSSKTTRWKCFLQPSARLPDESIPATLLPVPSGETVTEYLSLGGLKSLDRTFLQGVENQEGLKSLINGYSRWIMEVTAQNRVAFLVTEQSDDLALRCAVVSSNRLSEDEMLEWEIYEISLESLTGDLETLEFALCLRYEAGIEESLKISIRVALCIDLQSSTAIFAHRVESTNDGYLSDIEKRLGTILEHEEDQNEKIGVWERELKEFVGLGDIHFPTLSCTRSLEPPASPTCTQTKLTLQVSWEKLANLAQQLGLKSGVSVVRGAFAYTLAEYTETDKIILGDQDLPDLTQDNSVNLVPVSVLPQDTSEEFLCRLDKFERSTSIIPSPTAQNLRDILKIPSSQTPYNALFAYQQRAVHESDPESSHSASRTSLEAPMELTLQRSEKDQPICKLSCRSLLMDVPHSEMVMKQIDALVTSMCSAPTERIQELTHLFPKELLSIHSPMVSDDVKRAPLLSPAHWVDHWASSNPSWVGLEIIDAISENDTASRTWTYRELSETSDRLCTWIVNRGWHNRSIAVCLDRSFMAYCLVLAIWKSGNCYVPIAEDLPEARQLFLLSDSGATAFFADKNVTKLLLSAENCEVVDIAGLEICGNSEVVRDKQLIDPKPTDDCYLLYTSGSTGAPKGVLVSRGNLSAFAEAQSNYICRDVPDTPKLKGVGSYLAHASRAFDVHICEMVLGWRHGLRLVTGQRSMLLDNLFLVLRRFKITHAGFVPSLLEHAGVSAESLPDLRYLGVGGEKISETIIERFVGKRSISLVNAYGPTEATIGFTSHTVKPWSTVRNIGTAVGNITVHVLESNSSKYVKRGQAGELCVTGDLVASGYHRRPDAAGFTDHNGQRMYRTGDIVRLMANDCIEYLGRRDSQAKIRGQRLELEEVSIAIRRCAGFPVNVTSMITPSPITKRPQLVSFISPSSDRLDSSSTKVTFMKNQYQEWVPKILIRCRVELPAYMVPSVLLPVSSIPIQISGKADSRRLVALYGSIPISDLLLGHGVVDLEPSSETDLESNQETNPENPYSEPGGADMTADEMQVCDIICSQIETDPKSVTRATSIFQLGIDSLGALSVAAKLRQAGYTCSAVDVLSKGTIQKIALLPNSSSDLCRKQMRSFSEDQGAEVSHRLAQIDQNFRNSQTQIPNSSISVIRPCLPLQESIVSSSVGSPIPLYVNHIMCRLGNSIKLTSLKSAFEDLMQQNEILRTCFQVVDRKVLQVVLKPRVLTIRWDEVVVSDENVARGLFDMRQAGIASRIIQKIDKEPPFHILAASPICEDDPGWFMLSIHHSIFDGASMGIFLKQLHHHYTGNAAMCPVDLAPLYHYMVANAEADTERFWSRYLDGYSPGIVEDQESDGGSYSIMTKTLPFGLSSLSKNAAQAFSTAPIIVETAWAIVLAECLGQKDVIFGRVMNGRTIPVDSVEEMLVPLVTTIPGRFRLPSLRSSLIELAKIHTQAMLESLPHQHTPLRTIQRYTRVPGPLFNTLISYIVTSPQSPWADMLTEMESIMPADYPLALEVNAEPGADRVTLRLRISKALSSNQRYASLVDRISNLLTGLISDGDAMIDAPEPLIEREKKQPVWDEIQWTDIERKIQRAVAEVSGLSDSQISKNASFFALGIDSVVSIHLARCLKVENIDASPSDILRYPSIGALHNYLGKPRVVSRQTEALERPLDHDLGAELFHPDDSIVKTYPCTPLQTAMIGQCLSSAGKGYLHHHVITLSGSLESERLLHAWKETVKNADILRTSFHRHATNSQFHAAAHKYPLIQWSHQSNVASLSQAIEAISQEASYPSIASFSKPPWKVTLLTGSSQQLMVVSMHHCLYDGFSLPLLFSSLEKSYLGHTEHLGSFALAAQKVSSMQLSSIKFWTDVVAGYQYFGLPISQPSTQPDVQWTEIKIETGVPELQRLCGAANVTLQTVALLAFGRSLMPIVGQRDVVFGHVVSGRSFDIDDSMNVIGPLFNTVPFRLKLESAHKSTRSVLEDIQRFSIDCQRFQHAPLSLVQKDWRMAKNSNGSSLFDALFTFNKSEKFDAHSIFQPYESSRKPDIPHYRLNVEFDQSPDSLVVRVVTRDLLTKKSDLETWTQSLALAIEDIPSSCEPALSYPPGINHLPMVKVPLCMADDASPDDSVFRTYVEGLKLILSQVTHTKPENIHESNSVFTLGLDSILALDVSSQCRNAGLEVSVTEILQGETIRGIANLASKKQSVSCKPAGSTLTDNFAITSHARSKALSLLSLSDDKVEVVIPCLSGQNFYIASWLRSQRQLWEFTFPLMSQSKLDPQRLQHAWQQLQQRHSILRTTFAAILPDQIVQVVQKPCQVVPQTQIHIEQASGDLKPFIHGLMQSIRRKSSNLFTPPIRLRLVQYAGSDVLLLTLHHALYDARTISILVHDLEALYQSKPMSPSSNFTSFVLDTRQRYHSGFADDYWKKALLMGQRTLLGPQPASDPTPLSVQSSQAIFPPELTILEGQCREKNISMPSLMILAVARSLARTADVSHPILGLFQNGRSNDYPEIEQMVGPTVNMLPLVVPDALVSPSREALLDMQQRLAQRTLYDQTDLQSLCQKMKALGQEIEFNLLVNILWRQLNSTPSKEVDTIFTPLSLDSDIKVDSDNLITGETAVDHFDWKHFPGGSGIYLEISYNEEHDALLWKLDYSSVLISKLEAEEFLQRLEDEMNTILGHL